MPSAPVLITAAVGLTIGGAFAYAGILLARRPLPREHRLAGRAFAFAWLAASVHTALNALAPLLAPSLGEPGRLALTWVVVVVGVSMFAGLVAYLVYLLTGARHAVTYVAVAYLAQLVLLAALIRALGPGVGSTDGWSMRFTFERAPDMVNDLFALAFLVPTFVASVFYLGMLDKATTPTARWRIALVGGGLTLWSAVAAILRLTFDPETLPLGRVVGALLAFAVVLAYEPPAWATRRWGIEGIRGEVLAARATDDERAARREALVARTRDLI